MINPQLQSLITTSIKRPIKTNYHNETHRTYNRRAVTWTRVSTKKQEANTSIQSQKSLIWNFSVKNEYEVVEEFGGKGESAKTTMGKEFQRLLKFVRNKKNSINNILVCGMDRFSRAGTSLIDELREKHNVQVIDVTNPTEVKTYTDIYLQKVKTSSAWYENAVRKEKIIRGMIAKLESGYWPGKAPVGYKKETVNGERICFPDEKARFIIMAFELKANRNKTLTEIADILSGLGFKTDAKALHQIMVRPFYCGIIEHGLTGKGKLIIGKHQPLVSQALFQLAHAKDLTYIPTDKKSEMPLKSIMQCGTCLKPMTAYHKKAKNKSYYKCNTRGCRNNKSTELMHRQFQNLLQQLKFNPQLKPVMKSAVLKKWENQHQMLRANSGRFKKEQSELQSKIDMMEIRFALNELGKDAYEKGMSHAKQRMAIIESELENNKIHLSNFHQRLDRGLQLLENLDVSWEKASTDGKICLQKALFPNGILLTPENTDYRTDGLNAFVFTINKLSTSYENSQNENSDNKVDSSCVVASTGIEPVSKV